MVKKSIAYIGIISSMFALAITASAASSSTPTTAPGQNKVLCFDGTTDGGFGGTCQKTSNGAKGPVVLSNTSTSTTGDYAGAYVASTNISGKLLGDVTQLGYTYTSSSTPMPGNLSLNIPIDTTGDTTGDGLTDTYAFVDAYYCPGTDGVVDVIHDTNCGIWFNNVEYANWAAFVAAYPTATVATDALPFIIAERTATEPSAVWTVSDITLGKPGK